MIQLKKIYFFFISVEKYYVHNNFTINYRRQVTINFTFWPTYNNLSLKIYFKNIMDIILLLI